MLRVFPITLTGAAKSWINRLSPGIINTWDLLKRPSFKGIVLHLKWQSSLRKFISSSKKVMRHCTKHGKDHLQKGHDGSTSRKISNGSSDGIETIINKLDILGRYIKKHKENVHAIQVVCQTCGGAYLNKDCLLHEEVKSIEEVKYGEFG
ncbi:hypothetical protein Tco_0964397 [Tanacetum coccineum]